MPRQILRRWSTTPRDPPGEAAGRYLGRSGARRFAAEGLSLLVSQQWRAQPGAQRARQHPGRPLDVAEKGVALAGPRPAPWSTRFPPEALRAEVRGLMDTWRSGWRRSRQLLEPQWLQAFMAVLTPACCTPLASGGSTPSARRSPSPPRPGARWADLVARGWAQRQSQPRGAAPPRLRRRQADPQAAAETLAFARRPRARSAQPRPRRPRRCSERKLAQQRLGPLWGTPGPRRPRLQRRGPPRLSPPPIRPGGVDEGGSDFRARGDSPSRERLYACAWRQWLECPCA